MRYILCQRGFLRYLQGCTVCFTEKQRDLSILMPLRQSVFRPYLPKTAGQNQAKRSQVYPLLLFFPETHTSWLLPVSSNLPPSLKSLASDSAIGLHLLQNPACACHYDDSKFCILAEGRSSFHLSALEATFMKTFNSSLCRQKELVYSLKIVHK